MDVDTLNIGLKIWVSLVQGSVSSQPKSQQLLSQSFPELPQETWDEFENIGASMHTIERGHIID